MRPKEAIMFLFIRSPTIFRQLFKALVGDTSARALTTVPTTVTVSKYVSNDRRTVLLVPGSGVRAVYNINIVM